MLETAFEKTTFQEVGKSEDPEDGEDTMYYLCPVCNEEMWAETGVKIVCTQCLTKLLEEDEVFCNAPDSVKEDIWEYLERSRLIEQGPDDYLS